MREAEGTRASDMEVSDEINACSIVVPVEIDGATEEWLVNFKNETHHPTEIEHFRRRCHLSGRTSAIRCQGVPM